MGKSSKNFKRPSKKEKEQIKLKKSFNPNIEEVEDSHLKLITKTITKKSIASQTDGKKLEKLAKEIVEIEKEKVKVVSKHEEHQENSKEEEKPKKDYVDLMFGKKTYKPLFSK